MFRRFNPNRSSVDELARAAGGADGVWGAAPPPALPICVSYRDTSGELVTTEGLRGETARERGADEANGGRNRGRTLNEAMERIRRKEGRPSGTYKVGHRGAIASAAAPIAVDSGLLARLGPLAAAREAEAIGDYRFRGGPNRHSQRAAR